MEYPSNCQIFGNQYCEIAKQRKQPPKLQHHQTKSANMYGFLQVRIQNQPIRNDLIMYESIPSLTIPARANPQGIILKGLIPHPPPPPSTKKVRKPHPWGRKIMLKPHTRFHYFQKSSKKSTKRETDIIKKRH